MPAISTRFPTSTRSTYLTSTTPSIGDTLYRRSSLIGSYRSVNGDDSSSIGNRFGSVSKRQYTSTTSIPSSVVTSKLSTTTSSLTRKSIDRDRDYRSKPPLGTTRYRYESQHSSSRIRDLSLDNGYTNQITSNITDSQSPSLFNSSKRYSTTASSLARSVATSEADLYEKYSVANYKPNCELSRSRSLTDSKLIDSISGTSSTRRSTSKDRSTTTGSLLAGSASTKDFLSNHHRSTSPTSTTTTTTSSGLKVKSVIDQTSVSVVSSNLANSRCLYSISPKRKPAANSHHLNSSTSTTNTSASASASVSASTNNNNNNNSLNSNLSKINTINSHHRSTATTNHHLKPSLIQKHNNNNNNNNNDLNPLSDSIVVSSTSNTNANTSSNLKNQTKKFQSNTISSIDIGNKSGAIKKSSTKAAITNGNATATTNAGKVSNANNNNQNPNQIQNMNGYKTINGTISQNANINHNNNINNNNEPKLMSSEAAFKRRLGTNPLSPYKNPDFLKCEYDLARSQLVNSRSKSATGEKNNNSSDKNKFLNGSAGSTSMTSSPAKDLNRNKTTSIFGVNSSKLSITKPEKVVVVSSSTSEALRSVELIKSSANINNFNNNNNNNINNNNNSTETMNIVQNPVDLLDDIKYIDSDESERKNIATSSVNVASLKEFFNQDASALNKNHKNSNSSTLPTNGTVKKFNNASANKYNTITNSTTSCAHQTNGIHIGNGIARKAVPEEMLSSASSSTSTLSAMTDHSSTSSLLPKNSLLKESNSTGKHTHLNENGDNKTSSVRSALPPTPSRFDRDIKPSYSTTSRILPDTDAFTNKLAASSISDRTTDDDNTEGLCGLRNIGNTCFMNSIIQCLSHTKDLTRYLKTKVDARTSNAAKDSKIVIEFSKLIKEMWSGSSRSVTPSELKSAFSSKHRMYSGCSQQDAQEFLRFFLDALHCALNTGTKGDKLEIDENLSNNAKADLTWEWYSKVENSVIKDLFVGQLKSSLICTVCGNSSVTFDPFWDLSVPLPTSSRCKLESCLDLFIKEEILDGDEMPTCAKCKTRRKSTKSFTIQRFPKYLAIHLKRFSETRWSKLTNIVEFPTGERELNMAPYGANSTTVQYSLYGICNHMGSTAGGHYVAVCKHPSTRKWHEFNNIVSPVNESSLVSSSAYVLFYERVNNMNQLYANECHHRSPFKIQSNQLYSRHSIKLPYMPSISTSQSQYIQINHRSNLTNFSNSYQMNNMNSFQCRPDQYTMYWQNSREQRPRFQTKFYAFIKHCNHSRMVHLIKYTLFGVIVYTVLVYILFASYYFA